MLNKTEKLTPDTNLNLSPLNEPLTPRESEVLEWVYMGKTNWEIGKILDISFCTVKIHVRNILRKLNAANRVQAARIAAKYNLVQDRIQ